LTNASRVVKEKQSVRQMLVARATHRKERQDATEVLARANEHMSLDRSASQKEPGDTLEKLEEANDLNEKKECIDKLLVLAGNPKTSDDVYEKANRASKAVARAFSSAGGASVLEEGLRYKAMLFLKWAGRKARTEHGTIVHAFRYDGSERVRSEAAKAIFFMDKVVASIDDFADVLNARGPLGLQKTVDNLLFEFGKESSLKDVYRARCHSNYRSAYPCGDHWSNVLP